MVSKHSVPIRFEARAQQSKPVQKQAGQGRLFNTTVVADAVGSIEIEIYV